MRDARSILETELYLGVRFFHFFFFCPWILDLRTFEVLTVDEQTISPTPLPPFLVSETALHRKQDGINHAWLWDAVLVLMFVGVMWQAESGITSSWWLLVPVLPLREVKVFRWPLALPLLLFGGSSWCKNRQVYFTLFAVSMGELLNAE